MVTAAGPRVGVLALQGAVHEHCEVLRALGGDPAPVRTRAELEAVDALVLPGGESTTMARLAATQDLMPAVTDRITGGMPVLGTCAGLVLLAQRLTDDTGLEGLPRIGNLHITATRNAYGAQLASGEHDVTWTDGTTTPEVFIRAPRITAIGPGVECLAQVANEPVAVRQGSVLASTFHPELSGQHRLHQALMALTR